MTNPTLTINNPVPRMLVRKPPVEKWRWWQIPCGHRYVDPYTPGPKPRAPEHFTKWNLDALESQVQINLFRFIRMTKRHAILKEGGPAGLPPEFMRPVKKWRDAYIRLMDPEKCLRDLNADLTRCYGALQIKYSYQEDSLEYEGVFKWAVRDIKIFLCRIKLLFKVLLKKKMEYKNPYDKVPKEDLANLGGEENRSKRVERDYAFYHYYLKNMETAVELLKFYVTCQVSNFEPAKISYPPSYFQTGYEKK
ncbi:uncharacterized protein [Diabrotica undecimpunctata]